MSWRNAQIVDANVLLRAYFPDEAQLNAQAIVRDHAAGRVQLKAPSLLLYGVNNAVWQAERCGRLTPDQTGQVMASIEGLQIEILSLEWGEMLPLARRFDCSAYDAACLALAHKLSEPLITCDERLYHALHPHLDWAWWLED